MFDLQGELCGVPGGPCQQADYNAAFFEPVIANCSLIANFTNDETFDLNDCAIDSSSGIMATEGTNLLLASFASTSSNDPSGQSLWVIINGVTLISDSYDTIGEWGDAVLKSVCSNYAATNSGTSLPEACS